MGRVKNYVSRRKGRRFGRFCFGMGGWRRGRVPWRCDPGRRPWAGSFAGPPEASFDGVCGTHLPAPVGRGVSETGGEVFAQAFDGLRVCVAAPVGEAACGSARGRGVGGIHDVVEVTLGVLVAGLPDLVEYVTDPGGQHALAVRFSRRPLQCSMTTHPGVYCLRTNRTGRDGAILWRTCITRPTSKRVFRIETRPASHPPPEAHPGRGPSVL